ncbi:MAG: lysophospholipid acyltransferase family protein [Chitinophagaceae bacterium]|nr:lysophospholipid acyltransferase family protein [Chitinophagaceae bacterium]
MYYVVYGILYGVSLLPMWLLYPMADVLSLLLYYVIGYRRKVTRSNLRMAFPEKTEEEIIRIEKKFYRNFVDSFIETIKLLSANHAYIKQRFVIDNPEILDNFYDEGRKCQLHLGHTFNWEVANVAMPLICRYPFIVAYMPVENKIFERLFLHLRGRTGSILLPSTRMQRAIIPYRNTQYLLTLVADQAPANSEQSYWLNFFGRPTSFLRGPERGARIADIPAVFVKFYKSRRGHYRVFLTTLSDHPAALPEGELTRRYCRILEDAIREYPDLWLWSHRRWKAVWKEEYRDMWID